ncbi:reverse transcriptase domain-containing protein, partial [bacterium]|nr:reverse transcriptase domain-containing protein [bacterium]
MGVILAALGLVRRIVTLHRRVAQAVAPRQEALTIIGGDFNWTAQDQDRRSKSSMGPSGRNGTAEEQHFLGCMGGFEELFQGKMTHECDSAFSRIDRLYSNQHAVEVIDREVRVAALEWRRDLSNHRPVFASRRLPDRSGAGLKPITADVYTHRDFVRRVQLEWGERLQHLADLSGLGRLRLLKAVMRDVGTGLTRDHTGLQPAADDEDRLGVTMRFLRAAEQRCPAVISRCLVRYPRIAELVCNPYDFECNLSKSLRQLRDHAIELARDIALAKLQEAQGDEEAGDATERIRQRKRGTRLLFKLAPGRGGGLGAVVDQYGRVVSESHGMADILRRHWTAVFAAAGIDEARLGEWLAEDRADRQAHGPATTDWTGFRIRRRDVVLALRQAKNSSPGPDGIPYGAWRALGSLAVDTLRDALRGLASEEGARLLEQDYPDFNQSLVFFLPKTSSTTAPDGAPACEAKNVRPLNVTNCDNRLLATAVRIGLEPRISPSITQAQRGFLNGRSMIANILDVDEAMALAAQRGEFGLAFSFDLAAAFPSVEHGFFMTLFESLGWPPWLLRIIGNLYVRNYCWITLGGERLEGFALTRGIRQGCPLSPLLFAMATDLILRRLARRHPGATVRAWADDMAVVFPDFRG